MKLNDDVWIKNENISGTIVDISRRNGKTYYAVEAAERDAAEGRDGGDWPLFDCKKEDIESMSQEK